MKIEIRPNRDQIILSDPTVIFYEGKYHLYIWSYQGIQEYTCTDLNNWKFQNTLLSNTLNYESSIGDLSKEGLGLISIIRNALKYNKSSRGHLNAYIRPFIFKDGETFHLLFQNVQFYWDNKKIGNPKTQIQIITSKDLVNWSQPRVLLDSTTEFPTVSAPCLQKIGEKYRLLFTYDMEYTGNTTFAEPKYFAYADFDDLNSTPVDIKQVPVKYENGQKVSQVGYVRERNGVYTCNSISKVGEVTDSRACFASFDITKLELLVKSPVLTDEEEKDFSDSYVCDFVNNKVFLNARQKNRLLDTHDSSIKSKSSKMLLVLKSMIFNKEVICSKDI